MKKGYQYILSCIVILGLICAMAFTGSTPYAEAYAKKKQTSYAMGKTRTDLLKVVKNSNFTVPKYKYKESPLYKKMLTYENKANTISTKSGNFNMTLKTKAFLPVTYKKSGDLGNTQSMIIDGNYWYVLNIVSPTSNTGFIVRYDIEGLSKKYKVDSPEGFAYLRAVTNAYTRLHQKGSDYGKTNLSDSLIDIFTGYFAKWQELLDLHYTSGAKVNPTKGGVTGGTIKTGHGSEYNTAKEKLKKDSYNSAKAKINDVFKKYIKIGDKFETGHGQAFAKNPKTDEFWLCRDTESTRKIGAYSDFLRINKKSLKPDAQISFRMSKTIARGNNLAFDKKGNAYWYNISADKKYVKFYKGSLTTKGAKFKMIMQGLKYRPGAMVQSLSYNEINDRLYLTSDGNITSVPVSKLGKLKPGDVKASVFKTNREFESIEFDQEGYGYVMVHLGPEVLKTTEIQNNK